LYLLCFDLGNVVDLVAVERAVFPIDFVASLVIGGWPTASTNLDFGLLFGFWADKLHQVLVIAL